MPVPRQYPATRLRRTRMTGWSRRMVAENRLSPDDLIWPLFVIEGKSERSAVASMPGVDRLSIDLCVKAAKAARDAGIPCLALFPNTPAAKRSPEAEEAWNPDNLTCRAIAEIKAAVPDIGLLCDVALDPYTSHGHDGLLSDQGEILNDPTIVALIRQSLAQARAGADIIAPSDMMDGRVAAIRAALEAEGFQNTQIMAYAAKYASVFYGPFRDAVASGGRLKGDKRSYQMDPANSDEALREVAMDIEEGADSVMVKPGLAYLDIIARVKRELNVPTFAYQVSGEYAMMMAAVGHGWLDHDGVMIESLMAFKRAGADGVLSYFALDAARLLNGE